MSAVDIFISSAITLVGGLVVGLLIGGWQKEYSIKEKAYVDLLGHLDKGRPMNPTTWKPELRQANNIAMIFGNDEVKEISSKIIAKLESGSIPLVELRN
jgi:hypothetical protein